MLDQGAWEEVVTLSSEDAEVLQDMLRTEATAYCDIARRLVISGNQVPGGGVLPTPPVPPTAPLVGRR